jgi:hypothetical protein
VEQPHGDGAMLSAALAYAARGWPVFPITPRGKLPAIPEDQGGRGFHDATTDPGTIRLWWSRWRNANIGVPTGRASGFWVLDADLDAEKGLDGLARVAEWEAEHGALPPTIVQVTPRGGSHRLFRWTDIEIRNSSSRLARGVDTRGEGGYIIVPPSIHPNGGIYEWAEGFGPDSVELAEAPPWLIELYLATKKREAGPAIAPASRQLEQRQAKYVETAFGRVLAELSGVQEGGRNDALNIAAYQLGRFVGAGALSRGRCEAALRGVAFGMGLNAREVDATISSGLDAGAERPRALPGDDEPREPAPRSRPSDPPHDPDTGELIEDDGAPEWEPPGERVERRAAAAPAGGLPLQWFRDVEPALEVLDFVEGVLTENGMSVVYGESNCGKTFYAMDIGFHVALGRSWFGREVDAGGVVYVVAEGGHGARNRLVAFRRRNGLEGTDVPFAMIVCPVNLLDPNADRDRLVEAINAAGAKLGLPVRLAVVDTLSRALAGGNENAPEDMGALVGNADIVRHRTGAHLMFVHHRGKDEARGMRGHSLLRAAIDTEIELERDKSSKIATATINKQRDLETGGTMTFKLNVVELGLNRRGKPVTSCVVVEAEQPALNFAAMKLKPQEEGALKEIETLIAKVGVERVIPDHGLFPQLTVTRTEVRSTWLMRGVVEVGNRTALTDAERKKLSRLFEALREKGRIRIHGEWLWLVAKTP